MFCRYMLLELRCDTSMNHCLFGAMHISNSAIIMIIILLEVHVFLSMKVFVLVVHK